jgi:glycosyltransferase involved in cell wall biosynthesis
VTAVHVVVPDGIDDPARPSGGNAYDRRVCRGLAAIGWSVRVHAVPGSWPRPDAASYAALSGVVQRIPDGAVVLLDGLVASTAPEVLVPHANRLRLVALVHMPLGHGTADDDARTREGAVLSAAASIVTTSGWTRRMLLGLYSLPGDRVHVAEPGVDAADLAPGTATAGALLCVAAVIPGKGHDVLLDALGTMTDLSWHCLCVGSLHRDPAFAEGLRRRVLDGGLGDRVCFPGPRTGADLDRSYVAADLLVLASRAETYGMVVTEALARGLPVVAAEVGGVAEALGHGADGIRPGLLVPPDDPAALGAALRAWLGDAELRRRLRRAARQRRASLSGWSTTTSVLAGVLAGAAR